MAAKQNATANISSAAVDASLLVAIATKGGGRINEHFGHAKEFMVYEATPKGISFVGHRKVENYCMGGFGEDASLDGIIDMLDGVNVVLCSKIGDCPQDMLKDAGIEATDRFAFDYIETAIGQLYTERFGAELDIAVA